MILLIFLDLREVAGNALQLGRALPQAKKSLKPRTSARLEEAKGQDRGSKLQGLRFDSSRIFLHR